MSSSDGSVPGELEATSGTRSAVPAWARRRQRAVFGGDGSYDGEGNGPVGGTPGDPSREPVTAPHPAAQNPAATEDPAPDPAVPEEPAEAPGVAKEPMAGGEPMAGAEAVGEPAAARQWAVARPAESAVPPPEPTGDDRVDAVLARFGELGGAPVADHVEVFEDVQHRLQDVL